MLKNDVDIATDLTNKKIELSTHLPYELKQYYIKENNTYNINYPIKVYPTKLKSMGLDKSPEISGLLTGIKGQYLFIDNEKVFNIRKHQGYKVSIKIKT